MKNWFVLWRLMYEKRDVELRYAHLFPYRRSYCVCRCSGNNVYLVNASCGIIAEICIMCLL